MNPFRHLGRARRPDAALAAALTLLALAAGGTAAQERIYVSQLNPPWLHSLSFDRTSLHLQPDGGEPLKSSFEPYNLTAAQHFFVAGSAFNSIGIGLVGPAGTQLPPLEGAGAGAGAGLWVLGDYALHVGGQPAAIGVVDMRPSEDDFLRQIDTYPLLGGGSYKAALSPDRTLLYVARTGNFGGGDFDARIDAYDIRDPLNIEYLHTTFVPWPESFGREVDRLRSFSMDGCDYLMLFRRDLFFLAIDRPGLDPCDEATVDDPPRQPVLLHSLSELYPGSNYSIDQDPVEDDPETQNPDPRAASLRRFQDAIFDPATRRAVVVADTLGNLAPPPNRTVFHEFLVLDLSGLAVDPPTGPSVAIRGALESQVPLTTREAWPQLHLSLDGATLFEITHATEPEGRGSDETDLWVRAWDFGALLATESDTRIPFDEVDGALLVAAKKLNPEESSAFSPAAIVRERVVPASPSPTIERALRVSDGTPVVPNDAESPRDLRIEGSGLESVQRAFVGTRWLADVVASSSSELLATLPALTPAGDPTLGVVSENGAIVAWNGLKVVNPPHFLPATVAYVGDGSSNTVSVLNATSESEVVRKISEGVVQGPNGIAVSRDGKLLFTSGFRDAKLSVHCLVADPAIGCNEWNQHLTTIQLTGCCGASMELSADGSRLFVDGLWPTVDVIDTTATATTVPARIGQIEISTFTGEPFRGFVRKIALAPPDVYGREWLYVANDRDPHLLLVDVTGISGNVPPEDVVEHQIPGLGIGRSDGLAIHPDGSRLYFQSSSEAIVRVFDIHPESSGPDRLEPAGGIISLEGGPGVRNLELRRSDGRFLYVAARNTGATEIFDLTLVPDCPGAPCELATRVGVQPTGPNSNRLRSTPSGEFVFVPAAGANSVAILDARDGSATLHETLTVTGTGFDPGDVAFSPGVSTETGSDVTVEPVEGVEVTFDEVTVAGSTTVTSNNVSEFELPADFQIAGEGVAVYYDVNTSAEFEGLVTVCFTYNDSAMTPEQEASLVLLHEETCSPLLDAPGAAGCDAGKYGTDLLTDWTEFVCTETGVAKGDCAAGQEGTTLASYITLLPVDTANNKICGRVGSFSQFVAAVRTVWPLAIDIQPGESPNEISSRSRGKLEVAILSSALVDATTVLVSTVELGGVTALAQVEVADLDGDGLDDLVVKFEPPTLGLAPGSYDLELTGELADGRRIRGTDSLVVQ